MKWGKFSMYCRSAETWGHIQYQYILSVYSTARIISTYAHTSICNCRYQNNLQIHVVTPTPSITLCKYVYPYICTYVYTMYCTYRVGDYLSNYLSPKCRTRPDVRSTALGCCKRVICVGHTGPWRPHMWIGSIKQANKRCEMGFFGNR